MNLQLQVLQQNIMFQQNVQLLFGINVTFQTKFFRIDRCDRMEQIILYHDPSPDTTLLVSTCVAKRHHTTSAGIQ